MGHSPNYISAHTRKEAGARYHVASDPGLPHVQLYDGVLHMYNLHNAAVLYD